MILEKCIRNFNPYTLLSFLHNWNGQSITLCEDPDFILKALRLIMTHDEENRDPYALLTHVGPKLRRAVGHNHTAASNGKKKSIGPCTVRMWKSEHDGEGYNFEIDPVFLSNFDQLVADLSKWGRKFRVKARRGTRFMGNSMRNWVEGKMKECRCAKRDSAITNTKTEIQPTRR